MKFAIESVKLNKPSDSAQVREMKRDTVREGEIVRERGREREREKERRRREMAPEMEKGPNGLPGMHKTISSA